jgi:hypothetical protein
MKEGYIRASDPALRESAAVPFWEDICNYWLRDGEFGVYSQQPVRNNSTKAVDIAVGFYTGSPPRLVFVLLVECKRQKHKDIGDLESQLVHYCQEYFDLKAGGLAERNVIYGATTYGPKIRMFKFMGDNYVPLWGPQGVSHEMYYKDPQYDGLQILAAMQEAKEVRSLPPLAPPAPPHLPPLPPLPSAGSHIGTPVLPGRVSLTAGAAFPSGAPITTPSKQSAAPTYTDVIVARSGNTYAYKLGNKFEIDTVDGGDWKVEGDYIINVKRGLRSRRPK